MNLLKRQLAPITDEAWQEIDVQAVENLTSLLSARKFIDVDGPHGWKFNSVSTGQLELKDENKKDGEVYGIYKTQPLVEVRIPFKLNIWELDNINRGNKDADLGNLEEAAQKIANFEESAIYYGLKNASITGLKKLSGYKKIKCPQNKDDIFSSILSGVKQMKEKAVNGPYSLIVNPQKWHEISSTIKGDPLEKQLESVLEGKIIFSPFVNEIFLVSERGGDFKLTLGVDLSIGFEKVVKNDVVLFLTESFTFEAFEPNAILLFE